MSKNSCGLHKLIADVTVLAGDKVALVRYGGSAGIDGQIAADRS